MVRKQTSERRLELSHGSGPALHEKCLCEALHDIAALVARLCFDADRAAIRLRRRYLGYLPVHGEDVAGARWAGPFKAASEADQSTRRRNTTIHQETHGDSRRVPAAGDEPFEERRFCRLCIEMEGLGVELHGEGHDLRFVECVRAGNELWPTERSSR